MMPKHLVLVCTLQKESHLTPGLLKDKSSKWRSRKPVEGLQHQKVGLDDPEGPLCRRLLWFYLSDSSWDQPVAQSPPPRSPTYVLLPLFTSYQEDKDTINQLSQPSHSLYPGDSFLPVWWVFTKLQQLLYVLFPHCVSHSLCQPPSTIP